MGNRSTKKPKKRTIKGKVIVFPNEEHPHILLDSIYVGPQNNLREILKKYEGSIVRITIKVLEE